MNKLTCYIVTALFVLVGIGLIIFNGLTTDVNCEDPKSFANQRYQISEGVQTSADFIYKVAKLDACSHLKDVEKQGIYTLVKDIEIKASSYALINKVFFVLSLVLAIGIIVIPIVNSVSSEESMAYKIFSPTQLPAIVVLAGLCFSLY